jgi:hypothetical protein
MSTTTRRLPLSLPNILLIGGSLAGAIVTILLGNVLGTALLLVIGFGGLLSALLARRPSAGDWLRINAIEYRDERDARLAGHGFAVVGVWALVLSTLELVVTTIAVGAITFHSDFGLIGSGTHGSVGFEFTSADVVGAVLEAIAAAQLLVLAIVWGIANTRAVRRG